MRLKSIIIGLIIIFSIGVNITMAKDWSNHSIAIGYKAIPSPVNLVSNCYELEMAEDRLYFLKGKLKNTMYMHGDLEVIKYTVMGYKNEIDSLEYKIKKYKGLLK